MIELVDNLVHLFLLLLAFILDHLQLILVPGLLVPQLLLVVLHCKVVPLLTALTLLLQSTLQTVTLYLKEGFQLLELLLRLGLHLSQGLLEIEGLLFEVMLKL